MMIQFRFPIAVAFYCSKSGFPFAVNKAVQFAKTTGRITHSDVRAAAAEFVDAAMKARMADFAAKEAMLR